jgi:hypothetical protein
MFELDHSPPISSSRDEGDERLQFTIVLPAAQQTAEGTSADAQQSPADVLEKAPRRDIASTKDARACPDAGSYVQNVKAKNAVRLKSFMLTTRMHLDKGKNALLGIGPIQSMRRSVQQRQDVRRASASAKSFGFGGFRGVSNHQFGIDDV